MAIPATVPLIGSGFDQLAGQQQFWANFNARQENENIARANQAEQAYNDWLQRTASLQRADQELNRRDAETYAQQARDSLARSAAAQESKREFDVSAQLEREKFKATDEATKAKEKELKDQLDSSAEALAPDLQDFHAKATAAQDEFNRAQEQVDTAVRSKLGSLPGKVQKQVRADRSGFLVSLIPNAPLPPEAEKANEELGTIRSEFTAAKNSVAMAQRAYEESRKQVLSAKLQVIMHKDKSGNQYPTVRNPFTDKYFGVKKETDTPTFDLNPHDEGPEVGWLSGFRAPPPPAPAPVTPIFGGGPVPPSTAMIRPVAPNSAPANPYIVGRRYGNLRYLGGDPNVESSWQPVPQ